jgi:DNA (cytosine-5)-methyltransferase 1
MRLFFAVAAISSSWPRAGARLAAYSIARLAVKGVKVNELALFAGAGGGILGGHLLGWRTVAAVEYNAYARSVLLARQNDGTLPPFPIWDDVRTFDGRPWNGIVDVVSGGFPCQDISAAGAGAGIDGERSGLWGQMARIIGEVQPDGVLVENSPMLTSRGLGRVLGDLAEMGFNAEWGVVSAADTGAPHQRERIWIVAYSDRLRQLQPQGSKQDQRRRIGNRGQNVENAERFGCEQMEQTKHGGTIGERTADKTKYASFTRRLTSWPSEPSVGRVADGVACRVDRLKALGNGQVPRVAAAAWEILSQ